MARKWIAATLGVGLALSTAAPWANASGLSGLTRDLSHVDVTAFVAASQATLAPFAYVRFCLKQPAMCAPNSGDNIIALDETTFADLARINRDVNSTIHSVNDDFGKDEWKVNVSQGDCEDFALTKRERLIAYGFPSRAIRLAVADTPSGEGHAVVIVRTSRGDLVLDNRTDKVEGWREVSLNWIKIQSDDNPRVWLAF